MNHIWTSKWLIMTSCAFNVGLNNAPSQNSRTRRSSFSNVEDELFTFWHADQIACTNINPAPIASHQPVTQSLSSRGCVHARASQLCSPCNSATAKLPSVTSTYFFKMRHFKHKHLGNGQKFGKNCKVWISHIFMLAVEWLHFESSINPNLYSHGALFQCSSNVNNYSETLSQRRRCLPGG